MNLFSEEFDFVIGDFCDNVYNLENCSDKGNKSKNSCDKNVSVFGFKILKNSVNRADETYKNDKKNLSPFWKTFKSFDNFHKNIPLSKDLQYHYSTF